jgi:hypothetical protein
MLPPVSVEVCATRCACTVRVYVDPPEVFTDGFGSIQTIETVCAAGHGRTNPRPFQV